MNDLKDKIKVNIQKSLDQEIDLSTFLENEEMLNKIL